MREKLIELLKGFSFPVTVNGEPLSEWTIPMPQIRKALADHLLANGVTFATDTNDGCKWISVEDRLPKGGKAIICLGIRGDIFIGKWMDVLRKGDNVAHCHMIVGKHTAGYRCATHWMPLPESPKEENT